MHNNVDVDGFLNFCIFVRYRSFRFRFVESKTGNLIFLYAIRMQNKALSLSLYLNELLGIHFRNHASIY